jgi:hypothetical protein
MLFFIQKAGVCPLWGPYEIGADRRPADAEHRPYHPRSNACKVFDTNTPTQEPGHPALIPLSSKRLSCVEVETSRNARPEVQATTIKVKRTPGAGASQWDHEGRIGPVIEVRKGLIV